jgi:hypothetical protein
LHKHLLLLLPLLPILLLLLLVSLCIQQLLSCLQRACWRSAAVLLLVRLRLGNRGSPECISSQASSSLQANLHSSLNNTCGCSCCCPAALPALHPKLLLLHTAMVLHLVLPALLCCSQVVCCCCFCRILGGLLWQHEHVAR